MAKLRGGSTVGGQPIVSLDVMNDIIYQITNIEIASKMNKAESDKLTDFSKTDSYIKDKNKNGLWQVENATNTTLNNNGLMANLSNDSARFQLYASNATNEESTLFFRTGWNNSIKDWRKVVTDTILENGLNTKFDKTGGDVSGNIDATGYISSNSYLRAKRNNEFLKLYIDANNKAIYEASSNVTSHNFNKDVNVSGDLKVNNNSVYHTGTFNYNDFIKKNAQSLDSSTNLNTVTTSGNYYGTFTINSPVTTMSFLEVSSNGSNTIIQKIYSNQGKSYYRICNSGTWTQWFSMGGTITFTKDITTSGWTSSNEMHGVYEMSITHNLGSENITSVVVTDANKISMFTGFQVLSSSTLKVYSSTAVDGKVIINAIQ